MAEADLQELRHELRSALARVDRILDGVGDNAVSRAPGDVTTLPRTKAIEWILSHRGEPMRPVEIWSALQELGRDDPKSEIQVTAYDLWRRGRIDKIDRGLYRAGVSEGDDYGDKSSGSNRSGSWSVGELKAELVHFERELRSAGLKESSVHTYIDRTERFIRWLDGEYRPSGSAANEGD